MTERAVVQANPVALPRHPPPSPGPPPSTTPIAQQPHDPRRVAGYRAVRLLLDLHFTPVLAELICAQVDLDVPALDLAATGGVAQAVRLRPHRRGFAEEVLRAYTYQCAMCGFDGALGLIPWPSRRPMSAGTASKAPTS